MVHTKKKKNTHTKKNLVQCLLSQDSSKSYPHLTYFSPQWKTSKDTMKKHFLNNYVSTDREQACQNLCSC